MTNSGDPLAGITQVRLPVESGPVGTVNMYVLADGDRATVVDCGVWHSDLPDGGMDAVTSGLAEAGYTVADVNRMMITHAHIDHYGMAGALVEQSGAELWMHSLTDRDCENYRHPETTRIRHRDTYADHGIAEADQVQLGGHLTRWLPHLHSVVEATTRLRGGEQVSIGGDLWEVVYTPGHSLGHICLWSKSRGVVISGDHLLPGVTPPVTFERGSDIDPMRSYLQSLRDVRALQPALVLPGHGEAFGNVTGRIDSIMRNKVRRLDRIRRVILDAPSTVGQLTDRLVAPGMTPHQRELAINEMFAHIAYLRYSGLVERRVRPDGVYEWFSTSDQPLDVADILTI
ncbi:MBL fold metallo-hydrolase [Nakamurella sp. GG22]